jgi:hypothetical protein
LITGINCFSFLFSKLRYGENFYWTEERESEVAEAGTQKTIAIIVDECGEPRGPRNMDDGEDQFPPVASVADENSAFVLDPEESDTYLYVVTETGQIAYVPQIFSYTSRGVPVETYKHPMLVKGGKGRVAGEIRYSAEDQEWVVDNNSGRYSTRIDEHDEVVDCRVSKNVKAAVQLMKRYGFSGSIKSKFRARSKR